MYKLLHSDLIEINIPRPIGSFNVGVTQRELTDTSRKEKYSDDESHPFRELVLDIWYPVDTTVHGSFSDFFLGY